MMRGPVVPLLVLLLTTCAGADEPGPNATERFRLNNGLSVILRPIRGAEHVALAVVYGIGGDHDPQGQSGLAHLVEHLYVTGEAGDVKARTAEEFFARYAGVGCNAQTGDRYTIFATVFPKSALDAELREAAARMVDLKVTDELLERERGRLIAEVENMFGRIPMLGARNLAREAIRPTPRNGRKGGLPDHVRSIRSEHVRDHLKRYYKPRHAILVLAGAVDVPAARAAIETRFARLPAGEELPAAPSPGTPRFGISRTSPRPLRDDWGPTAGLAVRVPEPGSPLYAPFLVLAARLWSDSTKQAQAKDAGRISVAFPLLEDPSMLSLTTTARPGESPEQVPDRLEHFVANSVSAPLRPNDAALATMSFGSMLGVIELPDPIQAQNPYGAALSLARRDQLGIEPAVLRKALNSVTNDDLRQAAREFFSKDRCARSFVAPEKSDVNPRP